MSGGDDNPEVIGPFVRPPRRERAATEAGQKIGRFVVQRRIGAGGMGVVYVAHDPQLDRDVAIKLLLAEQAEDADVDPDVELATQQGRLLREAQAMARLNHPNVVTIYEVGIEGDTVFQHVRARRQLRALRRDQQARARDRRSRAPRCSRCTHRVRRAGANRCSAARAPRSIN